MARDICILLGERIRELRKARNWRQIDLAAEAELNVIYISDLEHDLSAMKKSASGAELEELATMQENAASHSNILYLATRELRLLDSANCSTDRDKLARMIADDLDFYIFHFNSQVSRFASLLPILKNPAIAETGFKMKDTLRTAKDKLETIKKTLR